MEFKKSDSLEIQKTISIIVCIILISLPIVFLIEWSDIVRFEGIENSEIVISLGLCMLILFIIMYFMKKENRYITVFDYLIIAEVISLLLSTFFAEDVTAAIVGIPFNMEGLISNLCYIAILFGCSLISEKKYRKTIYFALMVVFIFEALSGISQSILHRYPFFTEEELRAMNFRAFGTIVNQNPYGALMALAFGIECGMFLFTDNKISKLFHLFFSVLFFMCIVLSGTRGAMVGALVSLVFTIILLRIIGKRNDNISSSNILLLVVSFFTALIIAIIFSWDTVYDIYVRISRDIYNLFHNINGAGSGRVSIWVAALKVFAKNPILGIGVSNFQLVRISDGSIMYAWVAHNEYIDILASRGLVGFCTYMLLSVFVFREGINCLFSMDKSNAKERTGLLIAYVAYMVTAIFGWRIIYLTPYFYAVTGLMISRANLKRVRHKIK